MSLTGFLLAQAAIASAGVPADDLLALELFDAACIQGEVSAEKFALQPAELSDLPAQAGASFHEVRREAVVYRVDGEQPVFLVFFETADPSHLDLVRGCAVVRDRLDYRESLYWIANKLRIQIAVEEDRKPAHEWSCRIEPPFANFAYFVRARRLIDHSVVIQLSFRNEFQIENARRAARRQENRFICLSS